MTNEKDKYLDTQGYNTVDGKFIPLRHASEVGIASIAGKHYLQVYSTLDHQQHKLQGDYYNSREDAQDRIDAANRGMKNVIVETHETATSDGETERWEARKQQIEKEAASGFDTGGIFLSGDNK